MRSHIVVTTLALLFVSFPRYAGAADDPIVGGKDYLVPPAEIHAALAIARARLAKVVRWSSISRVRVVSATKLEAYFRLTPTDEEYLPHLVLQRFGGHWRITEEYLDYPLVFDHG
jgi:hypothetical protein